MKSKLLCFITALLLVFTLCGCERSDFLGITKEYLSKHEYFHPDNGTDFADYCRYTYASSDNFDCNANYHAVNDTTYNEVKGYYADFKAYMEQHGRANEFDWDENTIEKGDLVRIVTKEGEDGYGKYDDYSVYYYDYFTVKLYYIHKSTKE